MSKPVLLLLHGALGSSTQLAPLSMFLNESYVLGMLDFSSHGKKALIQRDLNLDLFIEDILTWMNKNEFEKINIFGYSMGGYAALVLAQQYPEKVDKIFALGTKLIWTKEDSAKEASFLDPKKILEKAPGFAERLKDLHGISHWSGLVNNTRNFLLQMGDGAPLTEEVYRSIQTRVLLCVGDKDTMARVEDTVKVYGWLPNAELLVIPNTPHPLEKVDMESLAQQVKRFFR